MNVVIIGPGRVGAGFLAPLFADAGWKVTFATRSARRTRQIGRTRCYTATEVPAGGAASTRRRWMLQRPAAVTVGQADFTRAVGDADVICTAVGAGNVPALAEPLVDALTARQVTRPVGVWVAENADCATALEERVRRMAGARGLALPPVGFAGAVASVAVARGSWEELTPDFVGDDARRLVVDARRVRGPAPDSPSVSFTSQYRAELTAKLHVFNAGHAMCAYLGWLRGHPDVARAAGDPVLRPKVVGAMLESRAAVLATYPQLGSDVAGPVADALARFSNPRLADPVARVARDPIRKLGPVDRLVGPLRAIHRATGAVPAYFPLGVAAALLFDHPDDRQAGELRTRLREAGVLAALSTISGLEPTDPLATAIADQYRGFVLGAGDTTVLPPTPVHRPARPCAQLVR